MATFRKEDCHYVLGKANVNLGLIFESLSKEKLISSGIDRNNWKHRLLEIKDSLEALESDEERKDQGIQLRIWVSKFPNSFGSGFVSPEDEFLLNSKVFPRPEAEKITKLFRDFNRLISEVSKTLQFIPSNAGLVLRREKTSITCLELVDIQRAIEDVSKKLYRVTRSTRARRLSKDRDIFHGHIESAGQPLFDEEVEENLLYAEILGQITREKIEKFNSYISRRDVALSVSVPLRMILPQISVLFGVTSADEKKQSFLEKFLDKRKSKNTAAYLFLIGGIACFVGVLVILRCLVVEGIPLAWDLFVPYFLGIGMNYLFLKVFLIVVGVYAFSQYRFYRGLVEQYDAFMLLVESDDFFKNDSQLVGGDPAELFRFRKENIQKIYSLPERVADLSSGHKDITEPQVDVNRLIEALVSVVKK